MPARQKGPPHGDRGGCPASSCGSGYAHQQEDIQNYDFNRLKPQSLIRIGNNRNRVRHCRYCDCVYMRPGPEGGEPEILEFLPR